MDKIIKKNEKEVGPAGFHPGKPVQCPFPMNTEPSTANSRNGPERK
jgi:hypothetical protein